MTVRLLSRERGAALSCDHPGCDARLVTGQIRNGLIRTSAQGSGWRRSKTYGIRRRRLADLCPEHAALHRQRRLAWRAKRTGGTP